MDKHVMNDQYGVEDLLEQEKYLIHAYGTFIPEATEPKLRCVLSDNLNDCANDQYRVFTTMQQKGWYAGQNADANVLNTAKQKFSQMHAELGE